MQTISKFLFLTVLLSCQQSYADSQEEEPSVFDLVNQFDMVFIGIPSSDSVATGELHDLGGKILETKFSILKDYGDSDLKNVTVLSWQDTGEDCGGVSFEKAQGILLVYGNRDQTGKVHTSSCLVSSPSLGHIKQLNKLSNEHRKERSP
ncbi:MAG TPA: hypothetical protein VNJ01_17980 [Bacteriovoracaceae bacterium]|nr:hypothetical protein [Bacteriovoracaceae bacterium]